MPTTPETNINYSNLNSIDCLTATGVERLRNAIYGLPKTSNQALADLLRSNPTLTELLDAARNEALARAVLSIPYVSAAEAPTEQPVEHHAQPDSKPAHGPTTSKEGEGCSHDVSFLSDALIKKLKVMRDGAKSPQAKAAINNVMRSLSMMPIIEALYEIEAAR